MLLHLDPFSLSDTDQVPALTSDFISSPEAAILGYSIVPAVPQSTFPDFLILEYLPFALLTSNSNHLFERLLEVSLHSIKCFVYLLFRDAKRQPQVPLTCWSKSYSGCS